MFDLETIRAKISLTTLAEEAGAHFDSPQRLIKRCPQVIVKMSNCLKSLKSLNDFKPPPQNGRETVRLLRQ